MKSNDSTDYTMATDVNPLKYVENQGKYMEIYLILKLSGQMDRILVKVTQNKIKEARFRIFFIYFYEVIYTSSLPIVDEFLR